MTETITQLISDALELGMERIKIGTESSRKNVILALNK